MTAGDLFNGRAEKHHGVGGVETELRAEGEFALTGPELDLDRAQWQAESLDAAAEDFNRGVQQIESRLGEILIALRQETDFGRFRRPGRIGRRQPWIFQLEQMEFDLKSRENIKARFCERIERIAAPRAGGKRDRLAIAEIDVAQKPAGFARPGQNPEG